MLIEFRVRNYRSLRDEQVLSLVAAKDKSMLESNTHETGLTAAPRLLRSAVVYGPNASGKTNLIRALSIMAWMVQQSASLQAGQTILCSPFELDDATRNQPSAFEATFIIDKVRYQYGFELTTQRVHSEYLLAYKAFKPQQWFRRSLSPDTGKDQFEFGTYLLGQKGVWKEATKPNSLFLSTAVQLNSEQLRPIYDWFREHLAILNLANPAQPGLQYSMDMLKLPSNKEAFCKFMNAADISIADVQVNTRKALGQTWLFNSATGQMEAKTQEGEVQEVQFLHSTEAGQALLSLVDESQGTQRLFSLTGPILAVLKRGQTLVVDELNTSMHPLLVRWLISLFHSPVTNPSGAQLLFSTHDSSLLDRSLFRRDQIWFVEKRADQSSHLYPLTEFSPRKNEALEAGYLAGRYGALPFFGDWKG